MSYTAPTYVDTKEQAVLALASTIKGEAVTGGDGSVNRALDILADVLAEQDVQVPQTDAGAILALAEYASGMVKPEGAIAITENGEGIDVSQYATADVSVSGGGGDASTATVTYTLTGGKSDLYVEGACGMVTESGKISVPFFQTEETSGSFTVLLYGGKAQATFFESLVTVVSGDAEVEDGEAIITGDCTVTVAPN